MTSSELSVASALLRVLTGFGVGRFKFHYLGPFRCVPKPVTLIW